MVIRMTGAAQLGMYGQHGIGMARHVDFWNNGNSLAPGIFDELAHFLLGIETAVGIGMPCVYIKTAVGLPVCPSVVRTPGCALGEFRISMDLQAPPTIVS